MAKTTKENFDYFVEQVKYWINKFHLNNWRTSIEHDPEKAEHIVRAEFKGNVEHRMSAVWLSQDWKHDKVTKRKLQVSALHEVGHLLLCRLVYLANQRCVSEDAINEEENEIIRRIESAFIPESEFEIEEQDEKELVKLKKNKKE